MGFKEVKANVIKCLEDGAYDHEVRRDINVKNLFQCGQLSDEFIIELIKRTSGNDYKKSPHHRDSSVEVHIFKPLKDGKRWYVKFYFIEPDTVFISVHESGD